MTTDTAPLGSSPSTGTPVATLSLVAPGNGLVFVEARGAPTFLPEGAIIGQHGSWNRNPRSGYKVIFVPFRDGKPAGPPRDVLTGFLAADGGAYGRPVGVALDTRGGLLVADDVGNAIWRVSAGHLASASPGRR